MFAYSIATKLIQCRIMKPCFPVTSTEPIAGFNVNYYPLNEWIKRCILNGIYIFIVKLELLMVLFHWDTMVSPATVAQPSCHQVLIPCMKPATWDPNEIGFYEEECFH